MSEPHRDAEELGAFVLGGLSEPETRAVAEHLAGCASCREELAGLRRVAASLDGVPPEFFLDGPGDELVLRRTLRAGRRGASGRRRRLAPAVAVAAVVAAVGVGGAVVGRQTAPEGTPSAAPTATPTVSGTVTLANTDAGTGASLRATLTPAQGWVRVSATVAGIPAGQQCRLVVVGADGRARVAGSWLVSEAGARDGTTLTGSALVAPQDVREVRVETFAGRTYVVARPA